MATATMDLVDKWLADNPTAPPEKVIEILRQQSANIHEQAMVIRDESRMTAEVDFDAKGGLLPKNLAGLFRIGRMYSESLLVPEHFQGRPADCAIAAQMAIRCGVDILTFLQSCYIVHGRPGIEAKMAIAMINRSGMIKGRIDWEFSGTRGATDRACTAFAIDANTDKRIESTVSYEMVVGEGWNKDKESKKTGYVTRSKWNTLPDLMYQYRSAMFLCRLHFPDVLMGMQTVDELEDIHGEPIGDAPDAKEPAKASGKLAALTEKLKGKSKPAGVKDHVGKEAPKAEKAPEPEVEHVDDDQPDVANVESEQTESEVSQETNDDVGGEVESALPPNVLDMFTACSELGNVDALVGELLKLNLTEQEQLYVNGLGDSTKENIRAGRGQRANDKAKAKGKKGELFEAGGGHPS